MNLGVAIYQFCENRRAPRYFVLMDQLQRSSGSVPSNIAEGYGRRSRGDYLRFLDIARGSASEADYLLDFCLEVDLLGRPAHGDCKNCVQQVVRALQKLIEAVEQFES